MPKSDCDPRALMIAQAIHEAARPLATILFGSRARGDHDERRSDIDIMLVHPQAQDDGHRRTVDAWAAEIAANAYGHRVSVQTVWVSLR